MKKILKGVFKKEYIFNKDNIFRALILLILASGIFIRFWRLDSVPPGIQYDEAFNGINAIQALETGHFKMFYPENFGREGLHINVTAIFIKIFGVSSFSLRLASALWGSLTLVGFFLLLREMKLSKVSILLGTFMMSFSFWHLDFSRTAFRAIMVPLIIVWMFYFIFRGMNEKRRQVLNFLVAGVLFGAGFYTYIAFRVVPLVLVIFGLAYFFFEKRQTKEKEWRPAVYFSVAALLVAIPIAYYFISHSADFWDRADAVSIFSSQKISPFAAFFKSLGYHLRAFFVNGDNNPRHNYNNQPLVPAGWIAFMVIGFVISIKEIFETIRRKRIFGQDGEEYAVTSLFYVSVLAQSIFWVMLIPGVLTIEGIPHSLRIIGVIPSVFLFSVLPMEYILKIYRKIKKSTDPILGKQALNMIATFIFGLMLVVVGSGIMQAYVYFGIWANDLRTQDGFERKLYLAGVLVHDLVPGKHNYFITAYNTYIAQDRKSTSFKTTEYAGYPNIKKYEFYHPLDALSNVNCDDATIVFFDSDQWIRDQYRAKCNGTLETKKFSFGSNSKYTFFVMQSKTGE
ncbi:MAG: phospholipid carrier-dependent glycosyltransferase [Candidatus Moranbacteria bacterium]|nr:phospholipid carrier-dependent glycosyltransferase [Candidatus Moranbacteria bacterium]